MCKNHGKTIPEKDQNKSDSENKIDKKEAEVKSAPEKNEKSTVNAPSKKKSVSKKTVLQKNVITSQTKESKRISLYLGKFSFLGFLLILSCICIDLLFQPNIASLNIHVLIKDIIPSMFASDVIFGALVLALGVIYWLCLVAIKLFFYTCIYLFLSLLYIVISDGIISLYQRKFGLYWKETCKGFKDSFSSDEVNFGELKELYKSQTNVEKSITKVKLILFIVIPILYSLIV